MILEDEMSTIKNAFLNAVLADASYARNLVVNDTSEILVNKVSETMTPSLATFLGTNFEVVSTIDTPDNPIYGSGFDAVVWRGRANTPSAGKLYVSMRGTDGPADYVTNLDLAVNGNAGQHTAEMVNWWLRETTPVGQTAAQVEWRLIPGRFFSAARAEGTGRITAADLASGVEVNGHSLGGYLASVFTRLLGTHANVTQTSTFNSAGIAPNSESVFSALQALIGPELGRPTFPPAGNASQLNYFAQSGLNFTTNSFWFNPLVSG